MTANKNHISGNQSDFMFYTSNISKHLTNIYETGELVKISTISILETVQKEVQDIRGSADYCN
jgi:hypothetical protein